MKKRDHLRIPMEIQAAYFEILAPRCNSELHNKKREQLEIRCSVDPKSVPRLLFFKVFRDLKRSRSFRRRSEAENL